MNWLHVAIWVTPIALLALIGELHLRATRPKPPLGWPKERAAIVKRAGKPAKHKFGDSAVIGAITDSAIIGGVAGGDVGGGLVGKAFRDAIRTPTPPLG